jgi:hypothetical protein
MTSSDLGSALRGSCSSSQLANQRKTAVLQQTVSTVTIQYRFSGLPSGPHALAAAVRLHLKETNMYHQL